VNELSARPPRFPICLSRWPNLQAQCDVSIPVIIISLKDIRHALQTNASLHEKVETETILPGTLIATCSCVFRVRVEQQLDKLRAQTVSKRHQRIRELEMGDAPTPVLVKPVEQPTPCRKEAPKAAELFKIDSTAAVCIKHTDHHLDGVRVECGVVAVDEGAAEFIFGKLA
jgi:hypothetical protein